MRSRLTNNIVLKAKAPAAGRREIPDGGTGLYLVVHASARRTWVFRYRAGGRTAKYTLGRVRVLEAGETEPTGAPAAGDPITLGQAREQAAALQRRVSRGEDPAAEKRGATTDAPKTFGEAFELFVILHARTKTRATTAAETERLVARWVMPKWKRRPLAEIRRKDIVPLLDEVVAKGAPVSANGVLAAIRKFFNWCVERGYLEQSPCTTVKKPTNVVARDRVLTDEELAWVWRGAERQGYPYGSLIQTLILTGQRRGEVTNMLWSELDLAARVWRLPSHRVKNGRTHDVPLSDAVIAILKELPRFDGEPDYVFATGARRFGTSGQDDEGPRQLASFSGFSKSRDELNQIVLDLRREAAAAAGGDAEDVKAFADWRVHDLRRTVATGMARLGVAQPVVEKVLNHQSGSFAGIVGVYQRYEYAKEKREALDGWAKHVSAQLGAARDVAAGLVDFRGKSPLVSRPGTLLPSTGSASRVGCLYV